MRSQFGNHVLAAGVMLMAASLAMACGSNSNNSINNAPTTVATKPATVASVATTVAATTVATSAAAGSASPAQAPSAAAASVAPCPPSGAANSLTGAGSTFDAPLFSKLFDTYNTQCKVQVNYQSVGSGAGIQQLVAKTVQFGATDAPMTDQQIGDAGGDVLHIPVTIGAVSIGYNLPGVKSGVKFSGAALAGIFLGKIKKWNDSALAALNPDVKLPDLDISVVHRSDGSGTSFIFTSYLQAVSPDWKAVGAGTSVDWPTGAGAKGSEGVAGLVKQTPGGIGYFELAYSTQNNITTASMQNKAGKFVDPSPAGASADAAGAPALPPDLRGVIVDGGGDAAYPISGFSWVVINQKQSDGNVAQSVVHLLWWTTHDGQKFSEALQYAPLPAPIVTLDEAQLKKVTAGGKPVLAAP